MLSSPSAMTYFPLMLRGDYQDHANCFWKAISGSSSTYCCGETNLPPIGPALFLMNIESLSYKSTKVDNSSNLGASLAEARISTVIREDLDIMVSKLDAH